MEVAQRIGKFVAARLFTERSKGKGQRNVEVHISEEDLAELITAGVELFIKENAHGQETKI